MQQGRVMNKIRNAELEREVLTYLSDKYSLAQPREGLHLSTLVYCLTKGFFDAKTEAKPTDEEVLLFALGYGLQDVLTPPGAETITYTLDGITYRPDFEFKLTGTDLAELKTTRKSSKYDDIPDTWIEYIMGGCYIRKQTKYNLVILHMMGNYAPPFPQVVAYTLEFSQEELDANWKIILDRQDRYQWAFEENVPPQPYQYCKIDKKGVYWECKNCRHRAICEVIAGAVPNKGD